jgi:hypothetical protein
MCRRFSINEHAIVEINPWLPLTRSKLPDEVFEMSHISTFDAVSNFLKHVDDWHCCGEGILRHEAALAPVDAFCVAVCREG